MQSCKSKTTLPEQAQDLGNNSGYYSGHNKDSVVDNSVQPPLQNARRVLRRPDRD